MNKIKRKLLDKIIKIDISSKEFDLLLFLTSVQEEDGTVSYVYYKDIKTKINCSTATVYNTIESLVKKGFLKKEKIPHGEDFNLIVIDNDFSNDRIPVRNDADGTIIRWRMKYENFIATDYEFLYTDKFMSLPVGAKKLSLYYLNRYLSSGNKKTDVFWFAKGHYLKRDFCKMIGVLPRTLKHYYDLLDDYISVGYSIERRMNASFGVKKYDIVTLKDAFKRKISTTFTEKGKIVTRDIKDNFNTDMYHIHTLCRKTRIEYNLQDLNDVSNLMYQYKKTYETNVNEINECKEIPTEKKIKKSLWETLAQCIMENCVLTLEAKAVHKALAAQVKRLHFNTYFSECFS